MESEKKSATTNDRDFKLNIKLCCPHQDSGL